MSKKNSFWDNPFGGFFDFNKDGKEDFLECTLAYKIFEEAVKTRKDDNEIEPLIDDGFDDYGWRQFCEDGSEFGIDPQDYETEEDFNEALEEAKLSRHDAADDGFELGVDSEDYKTEEEYESSLESVRSESMTVNIPISVTLSRDTDDDKEEIQESDYPNKRQYNAAVILAECDADYANDEYEKREKDRCRFILEQNDKIMAANYLTAGGDFLFSQAIKDNFDIPVTLPDEDACREFSFQDILEKIQRKDVTLALTVWDWCVKQFLPYADYSLFDRGIMTNELLDDLHIFSDNFQKAFREYLNDHADFRAEIVRQSEEMPHCLSELIDDMITDGFTETATAMFDDGLFRSEGKWQQVNNLMGGLILFAKDYEELETIEFVEQNFLPKMKQYSEGMILDEIEGWQKEITEYKKEVERYSEKYAYSRSNAWRNTVPDGGEYGLNPLDYDTEQEYLEVLQKEKYAWREWVSQRDTIGLDPKRFETEAEYNAAWQTRYDEQQTKKREEQIEQRRLLQQQQEAESEERRKALENELWKDKTIYTYCGVKLPFSERPYWFRTDDSSLKIDDTVIVPVGEDNKEMEGTIVSIGQYSRISVPFPVEKTKFILRKIPENN